MRKKQNSSKKYSKRNKISSTINLRSRDKSIDRVGKRILTRRKNSNDLIEKGIIKKRKYSRDYSKKK